MIRRILFAGIMFGFITNMSSGQKPDSSFIERYMLDFVVPDIPAFRALGTDPSSILRPSDAKKFAIAVSPFYSNGKATIPKNLAVEFSPWKLASSNWTLRDYNGNATKRFLYRSSFSIGAIEDSTEFPNKLAVGYRVSFLSKKADILYQADAVIPMMQATQLTFQALTNYWVIKVVNAPVAERPFYYQMHKKEFGDFLSTLTERLEANTDNELKKLYDEFIGSFADEIELTPEDLKSVVEAFGRGVDKFIEDYQEENWNASRVDFAVAWLGQSNDEELGNAQFSSFSFWLTWALRAHKNGQILIGANFIRPRKVNDELLTKWSGNFRYYAGTRDFRGFFETQYGIDNNQPIEKTLLLNLGAELRIGSKFWLSVSGGLNNYLAEADAFNKLVSSIDLKYGFNEPNLK